MLSWTYGMCRACTAIVSCMCAWLPGLWHESGGLIYNSVYDKHVNPNFTACGATGWHPRPKTIATTISIEQVRQARCQLMHGMPRGMGVHDLNSSADVNGVALAAEECVCNSFWDFTISKKYSCQHATDW